MLFNTEYRFNNIKNADRQKAKENKKAGQNLYDLQKMKKNGGYIYLSVHVYVFSISSPVSGWS